MQHEVSVPRKTAESHDKIPDTEMENGIGIPCGCTVATYGWPLVVVVSFEDEYGLEFKNLKKRLLSLASIVFKTIEQKSNASVGKLGLDLIVDKQGEVYIIEANDKPGYKTPEIGRFLSEQAYRHSAKGSEKRNLRILEYARFLSTSNEI